MICVIGNSRYVRMYDIYVDISNSFSIDHTGAVAERIERLPRSREVVGSSPGHTKPKV